MLSDWLGPVKLAVDTDQLSELAEDRARLWEQVEAADFPQRRREARDAGLCAGGTRQ